jgi:hypothetical protein
MSSNTLEGNHSNDMPSLEFTPTNTSIAALNDALTLVLRGRSTATFGVSAIGTLTLTFEGTIDGVNWLTINAYPFTGATSLVNTASAVGQWIMDVNGLYAVRARCSAYTSGTATVAAVAGFMPSMNVYARASTGKVGVNISGAAGTALDSNQASPYPANVLGVAVKPATANPANATAGNGTAIFGDVAGRVVTKPVAPRSLIGRTATTISATGATTIVAAQGAGVFADLLRLIITTAGAVAQTITISDGTLSWVINYPNAALAPGCPFIADFGDTPLPATTANTAWTANQGQATACNYLVTFAQVLG